MTLESNIYSRAHTFLLKKSGEGAGVVSVTVMIGFGFVLLASLSFRLSPIYLKSSHNFNKTIKNFSPLLSHNVYMVLQISQNR